MTPELVPESFVLTQNEAVRLTFESARKGYLYVIDQDIFSDGTISPPNLIYPTGKLLDGRNEVKSGLLIDIPAWNDFPNFFNVTLTKSNQTAIRFTMIHTSEVIPNIRVAQRDQPLPTETFNSWISRWANLTSRLNSAKTTSRPFTTAELSSVKGSRPLTNADSAPGIVFDCQSCTTADWILGQIEFKVRARTK